MALPGRPRITDATCHGAGCRVTEIAGRSRSRSARVSRTRLLTNRRQAPSQNVWWLLHRRPPKRGKGGTRKNSFYYRLLSPLTRRSRKIFPANAPSFFRLILCDESSTGLQDCRQHPARFRNSLINQRQIGANCDNTRQAARHQYGHHCSLASPVKDRAKLNG